MPRMTIKYIQEKLKRITVFLFCFLAICDINCNFALSYKYNDKNETILSFFINRMARLHRFDKFGVETAVGLS